MSRAARAWAVGPLLATAATGCGDDGSSSPPPSHADLPPLEVHLGEVVDDDGEGRATLDVDLDDAGTREVRVFLDGETRVLELVTRAADPVTASLESSAGVDAGTPLVLDAPMTQGVWQRPRTVTDDEVRLSVTATERAALEVYARGAPPPPARRERALVWTDPAVVDDPTVVGLARVLAAASEDGHGGLLLDAWFRRFATTVHSERAAPAELMDEIAATQGPDPSTWDLDALPFLVSAVHNRLDLAPRGGGCGELRVSFSSTHPTYSPLHLIFLFRQTPRDDDVGPDGTTHCLGTARRWARLSSLDGAAFVDAARELLDEHLVHERFLLAESVELTVSPWEWRQWTPTDAGVLDNPPLFMTLATDALNQPGALRDDFLAWTSANAEELVARTVEIPAKYRAPVAQAPPSVARTPIDLTGVDPSVTSAFPTLGRDLEIVGCPACHTFNASFVHTSRERTFSDFYDRELDARATRLDALVEDGEAPLPPFGPLQSLEPR